MYMLLLSPVFAVIVTNLVQPSLAVTHSLYQQSIWASQRQCAKDCFWWQNSDWLGNELLKCNIPVQEECYCRSDIQTRAVSELDYCVSTWCGGSPITEQTSATNIYLVYCTPKAATIPLSVSASNTVSPLQRTQTTSTTQINLIPELTHKSGDSSQTPGVTATVNTTMAILSTTQIQATTSNSAAAGKEVKGTISILRIYMLFLIFHAVFLN